MGTVTKLNDVLCSNISKVDDALKSNVLYFDDNTFCPATPTPTPTVTVTPTVTPPSTTPTPTPTKTKTPTPTLTPTNTLTPTVTPTSTRSGASPTPTLTPTPTPCKIICCEISLSYGGDCSSACDPGNLPSTYYLSICEGTPCRLSSAFGIYVDDTCTQVAPEGYYSDGTDCWFWDPNTNTLTSQGPC